MLVPVDIQKRIINKDLIISSDGIIQKIPFQWLFSELNVKSIKYIPGFTYYNRSDTDDYNSLLAIAVPNPDFKIDYIKDFYTRKRSYHMQC